MVAKLPESGRPKTVTTEENLNIVAQCFVQSPKKSTRKASNEYGIPRTSPVSYTHLDVYKRQLYAPLVNDYQILRDN